MHLLKMLFAVPILRNSRSHIMRHQPSMLTAVQNLEIRRVHSTIEVVLIRHGVTEMNEWLSQPGKGWGSSNFVDPGLYDTRLTERGVRQALRLRTALCADAANCASVAKEATIDSSVCNEIAGGEVLINDLTDLDTAAVSLVCASPLTRAVETASLALGLCMPSDIRGLASGNESGATGAFFGKLFRRDADESETPKSSCVVSHKGRTPRLVLSPLCAERLYLSSDVGRSAPQLAADFPSAGFDFERDLTEAAGGVGLANDHDQQQKRGEKAAGGGCWWYQGEGTEWRPLGRYCCPGEPIEVFEERLTTFKTWLAKEAIAQTQLSGGGDDAIPCSSGSSVAVVVAHWGVIYALTGVSLDNCGIVRISLEALLRLPLHRHE